MLAWVFNSRSTYINILSYLEYVRVNSHFSAGNLSLFTSSKVFLGLFLGFWTWKYIRIFKFSYTSMWLPWLPKFEDLTLSKIFVVNFLLNTCCAFRFGVSNGPSALFENRFLDCLNYRELEIILLFFQYLFFCIQKKKNVPFNIKSYSFGRH